MADVFKRKDRSAIMRRVKSAGNESTEQRLTTLLREHSLTGWRRRPALKGSPDFVWRKQRVALFVDGCFWHGCPRHGHMPRSHLEYWIPKLKRNKRRDRLVSSTLRMAGWTVIRVWECDLTRRRAAHTIARIKRTLQISG